LTFDLSSKLKKMIKWRINRGKAAMTKASLYVVAVRSTAPTVVFMLTAASLMMPGSVAISAINELKIVVGFAAGSGVDSVARVVAERVRTVSGKTVVVENRTGAGGRIAAEAVVRADPDGSTILFAPIVTTAFTPFMFKKPGFDPITDFAPITRLGNFKFTLAINAGVPVTTAREFVAYVKANPGKVSYSTPGAGTPAHFLGTMLNRATGIDLVHVAYRGSGPAATAVLGGEVQLTINTTIAMLPFYKNNSVRLLAVTGAARAAMIPDVPTFAELKMNLGDIEDAEMWYGFLAPGTTSAATVNSLNAVLIEALKDSGVRNLLRDEDIEVATTTPAEFATVIKVDYDRWGAVIRASGFTLNE
jgi:tripartite-type tricarboxylate transporter receptor subunit TctC